MSEFDHESVKGMDEGDEETIEDADQQQEAAQVTEALEDVTSSEEE